MQRFLLLLFFLATMASAVDAQSTNMETFQALALECMAFIQDGDEDLILDAPAHMPYIRSALVSSLTGDNRRVFLADSMYVDKPAGLATLTYVIQGARVVYERVRKKKAKRTVSFSASATLVSAQGLLLNDKTCVEQFSDTVSLSDLPAMSSDVYPETQAPAPAAGFSQRMLQPIMLTTATALSVYLFFTLRSESSNDEN